MEIGPNGELVPSTQEPPSKRKRGPNKPKKIAPTETEAGGLGSAVAGPSVSYATPTAAARSAGEDLTTTALAHTATDTTIPSTTDTITTTVEAAEASSSQPTKPRKPYTIRVGPDGTPLSNRFKKRLVTGNLGYIDVIRDSQPASSHYIGDPGPSTLYAAAAADADADAVGEVDRDLALARFQGPNGLAAFDAAIRYRDEDFDQGPTLSQLGGSSTGPGTNGHIDSTAPTSTSGSVPNSVAKVKNPRMVEASKRRWEKRRQDEAAAILAAGEQLPDRTIRSLPNGVPTNLNAIDKIDKEGKKRKGFAVPGNATKAANKRWSLEHATRPLAPAPIAPGHSVVGVRATASTPMTTASPKRVISISGQTRDRESTPVRSMGADLLRHRAGSLKPRSSLPLHLTPNRRAWSPVESQEMVVNGGPVDDVPDVQWLSEPTDNRSAQLGAAQGSSTGRNKTVLNLSKPKAPRSSLPSNLAGTQQNGSMGPPLSVERPSVGKGKAVDRNPPAPESSRSTRTRGENTATPEVVIRPSRHSLPSERASSVALSQSQPSTRGRPNVRASLSPVRSSQPSPSQFRHRLIPEIELITPRRYLRLSPVRPVPVKVEPSPIKVEKRTKARPPPPPALKAQPKLKARPTIGVRTKPKPRRNPVKSVRVVLSIRRRRRAQLILEGHYDPFRDDDSDDEGPTKRYGHSGLRPKVALPRGSQARTAKPQAPEPIVSRFVARGVETELEERYRNVLSEASILKRTSEHECGWMGCDAVLASEWHLKRHVELRRHAAQGIFKAGVRIERMCHSSLLMTDLRRHYAISMSLGGLRATLFLESERLGTASDSEAYLAGLDLSLSRL